MTKLTIDDARRVLETASILKDQEDVQHALLALLDRVIELEARVQELESLIE
jgi:hypothetical protein